MVKVSILPAIQQAKRFQVKAYAPGLSICIRLKHMHAKRLNNFKYIITTYKQFKTYVTNVNLWFRIVIQAQSYKLINDIRL